MIFTPSQRIIVQPARLDGRELAEHERVADKLQRDVYFVHPYSSWQWGANENRNGLGHRLRYEELEKPPKKMPWLSDAQQGGFNLPLKTRSGSLETVRLIRAMNVLRQYEEQEVRDAYRKLGNCLLPGGLLFAFFEAWKAAWRETVAMKVFGPRQWFSAAAKKLNEQGVPVDVHSQLLFLGLLRLNSSAGAEPVGLDR